MKFDNWRGGELASDGPFSLKGTGFDAGGGGWESGEPVEGAVSGVWWDLKAAYSFGDVFDVLVTKQPADIGEYYEGWMDKYFPGSPAQVAVMEDAMQRHGIVYSRAVFALFPFDESGPPAAAPPATGNKMERDGMVVLRGTVTTGFEAASEFRLGVGATVGIDEVGLMVKAANNAGHGEAAGAFPAAAYWTALTAGSLEFKTTDFGDGDYDLLLQCKNVHGHLDSFDPDWSGDANPEVDTNEKYLKKVGGWYDKDQDTATPAGGDAWKEGMVVLDNTAPTVLPGTVFPPP